MLLLSEELAAMRERAKAEGRSVSYDGTWRDRDPAEAPAGVDPVIRFRSPNEGETVIDDKVQGAVTTSNEQLDDLILLRSDGTPTYMLSVVVDDHDMQVSHVIRGDDHLTNAARQAQIYDALGWARPVFAHIPLIHGPDGAKLSKRHGALGVDAYRDMGYLPEAMRNYLVRLGWSHGDDEIMSTDQMIEWFGLEAIGRAPARFDFAKLEHLNGHYIRESDDGRLVEAMLELATAAPEAVDLPLPLSDAQGELLERSMPAVKARAKTLPDLARAAAFLFVQRPIAADEKAAALLTPEAREMLGRLVETFAATEPWTADEVEAQTRAFVERNDMKLGAVAQPLRAALTGTTTSPGIFDVIHLLGRDEVIGRIQDQC